MVEQYTENQYDDDLTDSNAEYDDSYYTGAEDLFDYTPDEESPISRLKSLVLSIDWEITDDVLMEFNEELVDLKDIWAGEKINLVYVQALEKLSKYIYQKKAESHPSAIKLLLTLYHNLEKIVTSDELSESEKKAILLEDVKRFENLKSHLKAPGAKGADAPSKPAVEEIAPSQKVDAESELINLKAIVLGIDWEITDDDLSALKKEVIRLENLFAGSRPKLILLQGIGTIGAYIKVKKSDSHADAFKVLHLFYESLEKIVDSPMSIDEEKAILFPAVEQFNIFKSLLGETISPEKIKQPADTVESDAPGQLPGAIAPAFSDFSEDEVKGFQADEEAAALGIENPDNVNDHVANFFGEDSFVDEREAGQQLTDRLETQFTDKADSDIEPVDKGLALQGVDVEEDDEEDDEQIEIASVTESEETDITPALSFEDEVGDEPPALIEEDELPSSAVEEKIKVTFPDDGEDEVVADFGSIDKNLALQGVDVESEADDDSDEDALPIVEGELAPALVDNDEVSIFNEDNLEKNLDADGLQDEIADTVLEFFEDESPADDVIPEPVGETVEAPLALDEDLSFETTPQDEQEVAQMGGDNEEEIDSSQAALDVNFNELEGNDEANFAESAQEDIEDQVALDIEGQLDDFFGSDDFAAEAGQDDVFGSMELSEEDTQPVASIAEAADDEPEEEVVFELVEEDVAIDSSVSQEEAAIASISEESRKPDEDTDSKDELDTLKACIDAAGIELEDKVLTGLLTEIDTLDDTWAGRPVEKTFLHLLRTVALHIDRYRYEAGSDAYELLKSGYGALQDSCLSESEQKQELLYQQTVSVLDWQQSIIAKDSSKKVDSARLTEPLFVQELGNSSEQTITFEDEVLGDVGDEPASLKDEISSLRKSLQDEISELKKSQEKE